MLESGEFDFFKVLKLFFPIQHYYFLFFEQMS